MSKDKITRKYSYKDFILCYSGAWLLCALIVFLPIMLLGRTFVWYVDGISQHLPALAYYSEYLRSFFGSLISGHPSLPEWHFAMGEGGDILTALHYYVIGDPFALLSVFFPKDKMYICYNLLVLLRCFAAGVAIERLINEIKPKTELITRVTGSIVYAFSFWIIFNATRHPYFVNPAVFFPLVIAGAEKIRNKRKPYLLIAAVALTSLSNFYFFYMTVILTVIYAIVRLSVDIKKMGSKEAINTALRITLYSLIGTMCSCIVLFQSISTFLNDPRVGDGISLKFIYPFAYYRTLVGGLFYGNSFYYMCLGFGAPVVVAVILLFRQKEYLTLKILWVISIVGSLIPAFGQALNGFNYITNRWVFAVAVLSVITLELMWDEILKIKGKTLVILIIVLAVFAGGCAILPESRKGIVLALIGLGIAWLIVLSIDIKDSSKKLFAGVFTCVCAIVPVAFYVSPVGGGVVNELFNKDLINMYFGTTESSIINELDFADTVRYSADLSTDNAGFYNGVSSTQYYWTNANPYVAKYRTDLDLKDYRMFYYGGYDSRASLMSLAGVDYFCKNDPMSLTPYGYDYLTEKNGCAVYVNQNALPFGYVYDDEVSVDTWDNLSSVERQQLLLYSAITEDGTNDVPGEVNSSIIKALFSVTDSAGITIEENGIRVDNDKSYVTINIEPHKDCETYLKVSGLSFDGDYSLNNTKPQYVFIHVGSKDTGIQTFNLYTDTFNWYNGRTDFIYNMGYTEDGISEVSLFFEEKGFYSFDDFEIVCVDMNGFDSDIENLSGCGMENVSFSEDKVTGNISLDSDGILVAPISYNSGWSAYVDGQKQEVVNANICYLGIRLSEGNHDIVLEYHNPNIGYGAILSLIGILSFGVVVFLCEKKRKVV